MTVAAPLSVSFSRYSQLALIPRRTDIEECQLWYTDQEKREIRRALVRDPLRMSAVVDRAGTTIDLDQLHECVGIETYMTRGLARMVVDVRRSNIEAVLAEQRRQAERGVRDEDAISTVSRKHSKWSRDRARKLAEGYSELLHHERYVASRKDS